MNVQSILQSLDDEIDRLQRARALLDGTAAGTHRTVTGRKRRHMSAEARARIAAAQRARWARVKAATKKR